VAPALTLEEVRGAASSGEIDTVLLALTDMQGRLQGKRLTASHFLEAVADHGAEACNYLLAVDVEMNTVPGYAMSSWERGYGDFEMTPDLSTLRRIPWLDATALVLCDVAWTDGSPVRSPGWTRWWRSGVASSTTPSVGRWRHW
jgi:glutamine synthetase